MDVNSNNKSGSDGQMIDILLVFDKEKKTINAVKGIDKNGEQQTVPPKQEHNNDFLKVKSLKVSTAKEQKPDTNKYFIDLNKTDWDSLKNLGLY